jgi:putative ABC transport system substrate-binding protein
MKKSPLRLYYYLKHAHNKQRIISEMQTGLFPYGKKRALQQDNGKFMNMKKLTAALLTTVLLLFAQSMAAAADIISVQSINIQPYDDALNGFKKTCKCEAKKIVIADIQEANIVDDIRETKPDAVIAIGLDALNSVKAIKDIPIVYLMVLDPSHEITDRENITGVSMNIPPEEQLHAIPKIIPEIKTVGILYDPEKTGDFVSKVNRAAARKGIKLIAKEVSSAKEVPAVLEAMKGNIDAFWMVPDVTVITPDTAEYIFLYSFNNGIPVITFSRKYLDMGALISLEIDPEDIGRQAGEIVGKILSGTDVKDIPATSARRIVPRINRLAAGKLGIQPKFVVNKQ